MQQINIYDRNWVFVGEYWIKAGSYPEGHIWKAPIGKHLQISAPSGYYYHKAF